MLVFVELPILDVPALQMMEGGRQTLAWIVDIPTVQEQAQEQLNSEIAVDVMNVFFCAACSSRASAAICS